MNKLDEFKRRSRSRNSHLYLETAVEGYDYVVCPVSKCRMSMIKNNYIENVLGMSVDEYNKQYPILSKICKKRLENISNGLKRIDETNGKTKYQISQEKTKEILSKVGPDGLTGYDRKGQKTRATHMSKVDEFGRNGYQRQAIGRLTTILPNGLSVEQNAHIKQKQKIIDNGKKVGASKISKKILEPILTYLQINSIKYYFDKNEYGVKDLNSGNYFFWDLVIPKFNMAIEYQSNAYHADPGLSESAWGTWKPIRGKNKTAEEVLKYDYNKAKVLFLMRGYVTYYVWENTSTSDVGEILCLLKTLNMKY